MGTRKSALFLDRDGVINQDYGYVHLIQDFVFVDGIFELIKEAVKKGYEIIVVTNQAGIGKGFYSEATFMQLTEWMCGVFTDSGAPISKVYYCPSHPDALGKYKKTDFRRKPSPGMLLEAEIDFNISLSSSVLVGDQLTDVEAGVAAGIGRIFLLQPEVESCDHVGVAFQRVKSLKEIIPML